jgi:hypothetical protein
MEKVKKLKTPRTTFLEGRKHCKAIADTINLEGYEDVLEKEGWEF